MAGPLRFLADDLTGALDAAAPFAAARGPFEVRWRPADIGAASLAFASLAFDCASRDLPPAEAERAVARFAGALRGAGTAFKKLDSRLRGHAAREIAVCLRDGQFRSAVVAPAFPAQGRITRDGRQLVRQDGGWHDAGVDLPGELRALGVPVQSLARGHLPTGEGFFLCDAEADHDLRQLAGVTGLATPVLWCGTGGLARALAGHGAMPALAAADRPWLALVGSHHPAARAQAAALARLVPDADLPVRATDGAAPLAAAVAARLAAGADALVRLDLADGTPGAEAAAVLDGLVAAIAEAAPRPGLLLVTGGDTLARLCAGMGAHALCVQGEIMPGIPLSTLGGGPWHGVALISKSGGFGAPSLFLDILGKGPGDHG